MTSMITPARVAATVGYLVALLYPGVDPNLSAAIVGAITGIYVLCVAVVEVVKHKHGTPAVAKSAAGMEGAKPVFAQHVPAFPHTTDPTETREIR